MYSGFITHKNVIKRLGVHQRFDMTAYDMLEPYLVPGRFPTLKDILHFEGYNGPDGLKVKSPGVAEPSHLYNPADDTGEVPIHIARHYEHLVESLVRQDQIRAAFEASWLAHFICDGLTPAHHFPLDERIKDLHDDERDALERGDLASALARWRRRWATWGGKGLLSTHFNFEMGIAFTFLTYPVRGQLDEPLIIRARQLGPTAFFKVEAKEVAELNLYERFYRQGWNADIAATVKNVIAPKAATAIAAIWLLAILEAEQQLASDDSAR